MRKYYSPLIGAALAAASLFQFSLPAFALGTDAGTQLRNRATASYDDGTDTYNVISNEVTVTVGKIAGITNVPGTYDDLTGGGTNTTIRPGDTVGFNFVVTNTGNDTTKIFIPDSTVINANANNFIVGANNPDDSNQASIRYSKDGGTTYIDRPDNGIIPDIDENDSIIVRVIGTVAPNANVGDEIKVRLGDTGDNIADINDTDFATTQNQPDAGGTEDPQEQDVRTVTADPANSEVDGAPVNGQREASATHILSVGSNPLALTRVRKTNSGVDINNTPQDLTDDEITYKLALDVLAQKLARYNKFAFNPAALEGRNYTGGTNAADTPAEFTGITNVTNLILVSDAIPEGTVLSESITAAPNWTPVYSNSPLNIPADEAAWTTTVPSDLSTVTRVGWVYDANANTSIAPGDTITAAEGGFTFRVRNTTATGPVNIYNLAQVFGSTDDGNPNATAGTPTFDESGDENPNNFNDDGTAGPVETDGFTVPTGETIYGGTYTDENVVYGYATPGDNEDNVDTAGDNTALNSVGGEVNKIVVSPAPETPDLLNGPNNQPQAQGGIFDTDPVDNNHDFQNLAAPLPATLAGDGSANTATSADTSITFINTVQNTQTGNISNVILEPISPEDLGLGGTDGNLPNNTTVRIQYGAQDVTFTYDGVNFNPPTSGATQVTIPTVRGTNAGAGNNTANYRVTVTLPSGTDLSTVANRGYPVPIAAYLDNGNTANAPDTDDTYNVTTNQVYLGYLNLQKEARVLRDSDGDEVYTLVSGMNFDDPDGEKQPAPGDIIEYRVTYSNISEPQGGGTANAILNAENVKITEDGTSGDATTGNNWALDNNSDTVIDTLHVPGEAEDSTGGTIAYFSGAGGLTASTDVNEQITRYVNTVTLVAPGEEGTFSFQRKITSPEDIEDLNPNP